MQLPNAPRCMPPGVSRLTFGKVGGYDTIRVGRCGIMEAKGIYVDITVTGYLRVGTEYPDRSQLWRSRAVTR